MIGMNSMIDSYVLDNDQLLDKEKSFINRNIPATYENRFAWRAMGFALANNELEDEAISYWQKSQGILDEFLLYGENEWKSRNYQDALFWYNRAIRIDTDAEVDWIKVGRTCQLHDPESNTKACTQFLDRNAQNFLVDPDFTFDSPARPWRYSNTEEVQNEIINCPDNNDQRCAQVKVISSRELISGASWYQCLHIGPGMKYRFSSWLKINTDDSGRWRPLYYAGAINGIQQGTSAGDQFGSTDWEKWEIEFIAPSYDNNRACFHPIRIHSEGEAYIYNPLLTVINE
jgi:tetratricopeptide (TPR) repeat protein